MRKVSGFRASGLGISQGQQGKEGSDRAPGAGDGSGARLRGWALALAIGAALSPPAPAEEPALERPAAAEDAAARRTRADVLASKGQHAEAIALYNERLAQAPNDVEALVGLARALEKTGRDTEARALFEKAYALRRSSPVKLGIEGDLERIYLREKEEDKLFALYADRRYYSGVRDYCRNHKKPEKFRQWVLAQLEKAPKDIDLRWYLCWSYMDTGDNAAVLRELEALRRDLTQGEGKIRDARRASMLADLYERLGDPGTALDCMAGINYVEDPDSNDWTGSRLTRLYATADQFAKALETCALRLRKDPRGDRAVAIGQEIAGYASASKDGPRSLDAFLEEIRGKVPDRNYDRFAGAVRAYFQAHPVGAAGADSQPVAEDPVALLIEGRSVLVPRSAHNLADFLEQLAAQARTALVGTFPRAAQRLPAPTLKGAEGPAMELLAQAVNGLPASLGITEDGQWSLNEHGDPSVKAFYAALGGVIAKLDCVNRRPDRPLWALGHLLFDPTLRHHVVAVKSEMDVLEATDDLGRSVPAIRFQAPWNTVGQVGVHLQPQDPPPKRFAVLRVEAVVVLAVRWATLTVPRLDHTQPITIEKDGVTIRVAPLRTVNRAGREEWEVPFESRRPPFPTTERLTGLRTEMHFVTGDGKKLPVTSWSGSGSAGREEKKIHTAVKAFDPATTSLVVRQPAAVKVVPIALTFRDLPVVER